MAFEFCVSMYVFDVGVLFWLVTVLIFLSREADIVYRGFG